VIKSNWSDRLVDPSLICARFKPRKPRFICPSSLDDVERGETLIITRHGRRIARIMPEVDRRQEEIDKALAAILELRKRTGRITVGELLSARDEGRKF